MTDVVAGSHIELTPAYLDAVTEAARGASALVLAEPYLLPVVERLELDLPVIYDAYNVEAALKAGVFPDSPLGAELLAQVVDVERRAVQRSARTTTCSDADATALAAEGEVDSERFTVIPNGTTVPDAVIGADDRAARSARWRHRYWTAGSTGAEPEHLAVFFGSWHPPNLDAVELLIEAAAELPTTLILSVGFHGQAFLHRVVPPNLVFPGMVTTRTKDRLLAAADVALNPMRLGSGTNLKLLEYLAVGVPVVSTPFGARGIEVADGEHLRFAEPSDFAAVVAEVLADPAAAHARAEAARALVRDRYSWDSLGSRLADVVSDIVPSEARK
ncbi:glycosyltransferase [Aquihabitans daechungensis]|uniref:glycosyltransferase n=1 Tax=Aquihabitans daechungensis TaxID=1052257 RepID=UPI003B9F59E7